MYSFSPSDPIEWRRRIALTGARISEFRQYRGLSQEQLAEIAGFPTRKAVSAWEAGYRLPPTIPLLLLSITLSRNTTDIVFPIYDYLRQELAHHDELQDLIAQSTCQTKEPRR